MNREEWIEKRMRTRLLDAITTLPGTTLISVNYWCLKGEANESRICDKNFYLGGEVELVCTHPDSSVRITWDENAGFGEHFSVCARDGSIFTLGDLEVFDASDCPVWRPHIGQQIKSVRLFGFDNCPFVIVVSSLGGDISIGSGYQTQFRGGDDVFIEPFDMNSSAMESLSGMWDSAKE